MALLYVHEHNPSGLETIVLLHGLVSSSNEYLAVLPFIPNKFHVLVPDLPGHSRSSDIPLTSLAAVADLIGDMIRTKAHNGRAHLVGLSFGGYTALTLCATHSDLVMSCFATGTSFLANSTTMKVAPYVMTLVGYLMSIPGFNSLTNYMSKYPIPPEVMEDVYRNIRRGVATAGYRAIREGYKVDLPVPCRTLVCAGASADPIDGLSESLAALREANQDSEAVVALGMDHVWDIQAPELFGSLVVAWIDKTELPVGIIKLSDWKEGKRS